MTTIPPLSRRLLTVWTYIALSRDTKAIAAALNCSFATASGYRGDLYRHLGIDDMATATRLAIAHGIISTPTVEKDSEAIVLASTEEVPPTSVPAVPIVSDPATLSQLRKARRLRLFYRHELLRARGYAATGGKALYLSTKTHDEGRLYHNDYDHLLSVAQGFGATDIVPVSVGTVYQHVVIRGRPLERAIEHAHEVTKMDVGRGMAAATA